MTVSSELSPIERLAAGRPSLTVDAIEEIVCGWQRRLGLERWRINVDWQAAAPNGPDGDETDADIQRLSVYDVATIRLGPSWPKWDRRHANLTLVHELVHMLVIEQWETAEPLEQFVPAPAWTMFKARYDHVEEQMVDRFAAMFVDFLGAI